jgi:hypothetical protein
MTVAERFARRYVVDPSGCWLWRNGVAGPSAYGHLRYKGKTEAAHRVSWLLHIGPIPKGLFVCHHCDVPACVNPSHLFLGDARANNLDCIAKGRWRSKVSAESAAKGRERSRASHLARTRCKHGHKYNSANTYRTPSGHRVCRKCNAAAARRLAQKKARPPHTKEATPS